MRVGVLTGGGDCPGLNAVIRSVVRKGVQEWGYEFIGLRDGWLGAIEDRVVPLDIPAVRGILPRGGPSSAPPVPIRSRRRTGKAECGTPLLRTVLTR